MFILVIPLLLTTSLAQQDLSYPQLVSAASDAQIRFALENKYDDTGPGAKRPEYAYKTFKTLEEALVGYLDDPETKLPEHERAKAINTLIQNDHAQEGLQRYQPKTVEQYVGLRQKPQAQPIVVTRYSFPSKTLYDTSSKLVRILNLKGLDDGSLNRLQYEKTEPFRLQKVQAVKGNPVSLAHYTRDQGPQEQFDPNPKYSFSYGVQDKNTGDLKSAQEARDGSKVRGYYTFVDAQGQQRTVHYVADDKSGFRASVQQSHVH